MVTGKVTRIGAVLLTALSVSFAANAEGKRYLVKFKSAQTFKAVTQKFERSNIFDTARVNGARLFNTNTAVTKSLDKVEMLVIESKDPAALKSLRANPNIALVEEEIFHPAPEPMATHGKSIQAVQPMARATDIETPWGINSVKAPDAWNTTRGAGARVMVLDTGLDNSHISIRDNFEKGKNFTTNDIYDITDDVGHGTHVSGTILADGRMNGLVGVAPEAKLLMGKVCSARGCSSIALAEGINWAVEEAVDVVNMSLGGWFISEGEAQALIAAEKAGVFVAAASGNGGNELVSYPAAFISVLAVGATDMNNVKADFSQWGPELDVMGPGVDVLSSVPVGTGRTAIVMLDTGKGLADIKSLPFVGSPLRQDDQNELVFAGLGKPGDFKNIDVSGKFALISRGEITFADKVKNAINAGAAGVLIYNNAPGLLQGALSEDGSEVLIPAAMIEQTLGEEAKTALASGTTVRASLSIAPWDYAVFQGTSMATPHVAGVAALVRAANKNLTPEQVRDVLKGTAMALEPNDRNQYGSGLVNAAAGVARAQSMSTAPNLLLRVAN
jgi:serine protease